MEEMEANFQVVSKLKVENGLVMKELLSEGISFILTSTDLGCSELSNPIQS